MSNPYTNLVLEDLRQSTVAQGIPGQAISSAPETDLEKAMAVAEAIDPGFIPPGIAIGMTRWKKALPLTVPEWAVENYPAYVRKLKRVFSPNTEKFQPQERLKDARDYVKSLRETEKSIFNRDALKARSSFREVGKEDKIPEAVEKVEKELLFSPGQHTLEALKRRLKNIRESVGVENVHLPKKQIPTKPDKRKLSSTRANEALDQIDKLTKGYGAKRLTHKEASKRYSEEAKKQNWQRLLEEFQRKKRRGE